MSQWLDSLLVFHGREQSFNGDDAEKQIDLSAT